MSAYLLIDAEGEWHCTIELFDTDFYFDIRKTRPKILFGLFKPIRVAHVLRRYTPTNDMLHL